MSTYDQARQINGHGASKPRDAHVQITMAAQGPIDEASLEDSAMRALAAIEEHATGVALGPVVAWNVERGDIDLDFTVEAATTSEVHQRVGIVMAIIERTLPVFGAACWLVGSDTGVSSEAICAHMLGIPTGRPAGIEAPRDQWDRGRCVRLLDSFPDWWDRLDEMAQYGDGWAEQIPLIRERT